MKEWREQLERQILLFPVFIVICVSVVFLLGGRVQPWIWWMTLAATCILPAITLRSFAALRYSAAFAGFLVLVWIATGTSFSSFYDGLSYHLPAIRMMIDGWNPVTQATREALKSAGYSPEECWWLHVLSMPKSVWYFSAAAYSFFNDPWNIMFPLLPFMYLAVAFSVCRVMGEVHWAYKATGLLVLFLSMPKMFFVVDAAVALAGAGLLLNMYDTLKNGRWSWTRLLVFSFWMCTSKQTGLFHCFLFYVGFAAFYLRSRHSLKRIATVGAVLTASVLIVNASPYLTAWRHFGHPLYPRMRAPGSNMPTYDITSDFYNANEDTKQMGHIGRFVCAFVSKNAAHQYYKVKLHRDIFEPRARYWEGDSPTSWWVRIGLLASLAVMLAFGDRQQRQIIPMIVVPLALMPTQMIGYIRYTPWVFVAFLFALHDAMASKVKAVRYGVAAMALAVALPCLAVRMVKTAPRIEGRAALNEYLKGGAVLEKVFTEPLGYEVAFPGEFWIQALNARLLLKEVGAFQSAEVIKLEETDMKRNRYVPFFDYSFLVDDCEGILRLSRFQRMNAGLEPKTKAAYLICAAKSWTFDLWLCLYARIKFSPIRW